RGVADRGVLLQCQLSLLDRGRPGPRLLLRDRRVRHRAWADQGRGRLGPQPRPLLRHPRQRSRGQLAGRRARRRAGHRGAAKRDARGLYRQARRPARRPLGGAHRRGRGGGVGSDQPRGPGRQRHAPGPGARRDGDGALPRAGRQHHDAAELRLLDRAGIAGLAREGEREPGEPAAVRNDLGVRGQERDPVRVEDGARRVTAIAPALHRARRGAPRPVLAAIAVGWALAIVAEVTGRAHALHHDALIEGGPPLWTALLLFLVAWQAMIAAMMLPSSLPLMRLFEAASRKQEHLSRVRGAFVAGYVVVWTVFGALAFTGDVAVHRTVDSWPWLSEREW